MGGEAHSLMSALKGEKNHNWNGGRVEQGKYILVLAREHPRANRAGYVAEHILIAETAVKRVLIAPEQVHHVNGQKKDNRNKNLVICQDKRYHSLLHQRTRAFYATGNPIARKCVYCKQWGTDLYIRPSTDISYHRCCHAAYEFARLRKVIA